MTNGMKPGSGSDPFADHNDNDESNNEDNNANNEIEQSQEAADQVEGTPTEQDTSRLPFIYARDGVKTARDHTFQLHYQDETYQQEKQVQAKIENQLGEDIYKVDLREAAMVAAFENIEDIESVLRKWGYDAD